MQVFISSDLLASGLFYPILNPLKNGRAMEIRSACPFLPIPFSAFFWHPYLLEVTSGNGKFSFIFLCTQVIGALLLMLQWWVTSFRANKCLYYNMWHPLFSISCPGLLLSANCFSFFYQTNMENIDDE